jgi:hypothetical protein
MRRFFLLLLLLCPPLAAAADPPWLGRAEAARAADPRFAAEFDTIDAYPTRAGFLRFRTEAALSESAAPLHVLALAKGEEVAELRAARAAAMSRHAAAWGDALPDLVAAESDPRTRALLVAGYRFAGSDLARAGLSNAGQDPDELVRLEAVDANARRAGSGFPELLRASLRDPAASVRAAAAQALSARGDSSDAPRLVAMLTDTDAAVRLAALHGAARLDARAIGAARLDVLARDGDPRVARAARALTD